MTTLSIQQSRLQDDLRGLISGDVRCDNVILQLYSTDAGMFEYKPLGVIYPRSVHDVVATIRYASELKIPVHPRGSGTSLNGGSLGNGLILDFTRYMKRMIHADDESVLVQPGAVRERVNDLLRRTKRHFFSPSAGHLPTNTLGSILATDSIGPRWLRYGFPHDYIRELQVVLPNGTIKNLRPVPLNDLTDPLEINIVQIIKNASDSILKEQKSNAIDCPGYRLEGVIQNEMFHFARLIAGSEGTLGIITEALLSTTVLANNSGAIIFLFDSMEKATKAILPILDSQPTLCELIDRRIINMVRDWDKRFIPILPNDTEVAVIVELDCDSPRELSEKLNLLVHRIRDQKGLSFGSWLAFHHAETELFRDLLRKSQVALFRIAKPFQIISLLEDIIVPVSTLPSFIHEIQNILKKNEITYSLSGHIGIGQIRLQPILDTREPFFLNSMTQWASEIFALVDKYGGTVGAAKGLGRAKSLTIPKRYPNLAPVFAHIKKLIDPKNIFNPGIIVPQLPIFNHLSSNDFSVPPLNQWNYSNISNSFNNSDSQKNSTIHKEANNSKNVDDLKRFDHPIDLDNSVSSEAEDCFDSKKSIVSRNASPKETKDQDILFSSRQRSNDCSSQEIDQVLNQNLVDSTTLQEKPKPNQKSNQVSKSFQNGFDETIKNEIQNLLANKNEFRSLFSSFESSTNIETFDSTNQVVFPQKSASENNSFESQLAFQLKWEANKISDSTFSCSGCGLCRSRTPEVRMCPIFRHTPDETVSCRTKSNFLRGILDGKLQLETLTNEDARIISEYCLFCHCCVQECPSKTDIPKLVFHIKSAYNAAHGLSLSDRFFSNIDIILNITSIFSGIMNYIQTNRTTRWILEKTLNLPQGRKLPKLSRLSYLSRLALKKRQSSPIRRSERKIALFLDTYANHYDLKLVEAAVKILEHNGITVYIPRRQKNSGHQAFSLGDNYKAEIISQRNVNALIDAVRQGYQVITLEPISAVCIRQEYLYLHDDQETRLVAENTMDICSYLYGLHQEGMLELNFSPLPYSLGYHAPCRTLALTGDSLNVSTPAQELLQLIPALNVRRLERGCCGSGGVIGMKKKNYARSLRLGMPLFLALREPTIQIGCSECNSCRIQMEQGTDKNVLHPLKILAFAYGLMPEFIALFNLRSEKSKTIT
ncbi:MAG: FAD-linked oxidase C-terminal domain-containing protein [Planctomycetia bacterium]|nr:FAD-linked oxidase C-terminal domain-containing protein [Planctomycetia bacterium]